MVSSQDAYSRMGTDFGVRTWDAYRLQGAYSKMATPNNSLDTGSAIRRRRNYESIARLIDCIARLANGISLLINRTHLLINNINRLMNGIDYPINAINLTD